MWHRVSPTLLAYLSRIPSTCSGLALGLAGLSGAWCAAEVHFTSFDGACTGGAYPVWGLSLVMTGLLVLKMAVCFPVVLDELALPATCAAWGPMPILIMMYARFVHQHYLSVDARIGIWIGASFQMILMSYFLRLCWHNRVLPEPFYFPVVVSISAVTFTGTQRDATGRYITELHFWLGILILLVCLPVCAYRVLRHPTAVAASPSVAILMAPASFMSLSYYNAPPSLCEHMPYCTDVLPTALFGCSTLFFVLSWYCVFRRRHIILSEPFSPAWAAFTFPSMSTATAAVIWTAETAHHHQAALLYAYFQLIWATLLTSYIVIRFIVCLPSWCKPPADTAEAARLQEEWAALGDSYNSRRLSYTVGQSGIHSIIRGALAYNIDGTLHREVPASYGFESSMPRAPEEQMYDQLQQPVSGKREGYMVFEAQDEQEATSLRDLGLL